jgi:hypothetical protein
MEEERKIRGVRENRREGKNKTKVREKKGKQE